jgi:hypothetical protein
LLTWFQFNFDITHYKGECRKIIELILFVYYKFPKIGYSIEIIRRIVKLRIKINIYNKLLEIKL